MAFRTNAGRGSNGHGVALFATTAGTGATQLVITTAPGTGGASPYTVSPTPVVTAKSGAGVTDTSFVGVVTCTLNVLSGSPVLSGTTTKTAVAGVADFSANGLTVTGAGTWTLTFSSGSLSPAVTSTGTTTAGGTVNRADTFTRADTTSGFGTPSDNAGAYTARFGTGGISSNAGYSVTDGALPGGDNAAVSTLAASAHGTLSIDVATAVTGSLGLVFNLIDASNFWYVQLYFNGTSTWSVFASKVVAGTLTQTQSLFASGSVAVNSTLQIIIAADGSFVCKIITSGVTTQQFTQVAEAALVSGTNIGPYVQVGGPKVKNLVWTGS